MPTACCKSFSHQDRRKTRATHRLVISSVRSNTPHTIPFSLGPNAHNTTYNTVVLIFKSKVFHEHSLFLGERTYLFTMNKSHTTFYTRFLQIAKRALLSLSYTRYTQTDLPNYFSFSELYQRTPSASSWYLTSSLSLQPVLSYTTFFCLFEPFYTKE